MNTAKDYKEFCSNAVEGILALSRKAISTQGRCTIALSGGSTPQGVYSLMATPAYRDRFDWKNIHFFLGDERWVPSDNSRSNCKMIEDALFSKLNSKYNFYPVKTGTPDAATSAELYEKELVQLFNLKANEFPRFDLMLLGLGPDGHTASLMPGDPALDEKKRLAIAVAPKGYPEERVTLTLPVINNAQVVFFLVSGAEKARVLKEILEGKSSLPAARVKPQNGELVWFADQQAASLTGQK